MRRRIPLFLCTALLTGCAVGPDFVKPRLLENASYGKEAFGPPMPGRAKPLQQLTQGQDIPAEWWGMFHSEALNALITQALKNNPDLKSARAALKQAQENVSAQEASFLPAVEADFQPMRQKTAGIIQPVLNSGKPIFNLYTAQLSATWTPDIFGGNRRAVEALAAQEEFERFQLEAAYLTLTSNLVAAAIEEASLRQQIEATQKIIHIEEEQLTVIRKQFGLNIVPEMNIITQQTILAQARAMLPPLNKQLVVERDLITALAGKLPNEEPLQTFDFAALHLPEQVPLSLPSKLAEQRPDIRSAEAQLHAASAQVGVAIANMLPNITLAATDGSTAAEFSRLFTSGTGFFSLAGNATQTLFDAGSQLHKKRAASAALDQAAAEYQSTVVNAFRNVSDALRALQYDADSVTANTDAEHYASISLSVVRRQVDLGSTGYLALLIAEQSYQQTALNLIQAKASLYSDTAVLIQALGGGWWNRPDNKNPPSN